MDCEKRIAIVVGGYVNIDEEIAILLMLSWTFAVFQQRMRLEGRKECKILFPQSFTSCRRWDGHQLQIYFSK